MTFQPLTFSVPGDFAVNAQGDKKKGGKNHKGITFKDTKYKVALTTRKARFLQYALTKCKK